MSETDADLAFWSLPAARDLFLNEAALTGECFPAEKSPSVIAEETLLSQRVNCLTPSG